MKVVRPAWVLAVCLAGCMAPPPPPADHLIGPPSGPPPVAAPPEPETPGPRPTWVPPAEQPRAPASPPLAPPPPGPVLTPDPLPAPWPPNAPPVVAPAVQRRELISADIVGVADLDGPLALSANGGLYRAPQARLPVSGAWTPLPTGFTRLEAGGNHLIACRPEGAWRSTDAGAQWAPTDFGCGAGGRRTLKILPPTLVRLEGDAVVVRALPEDADVARTVVPVDTPKAIGGADQTVVVFGAREVAWSSDGGRTFQRGSRDDDGAVDVRDVTFVGKGLGVAVGGAADGGSILRSVDAGRTWHRVGDVPRRAEDLWAVAAGVDGRLLAVTGFERAQAVGGAIDGLRWWLDAEVDLAAPAVAARPRGGFLVGRPRGVLAATDAALPVPALDRPLRAIATPHPRVWVGVGADGGLFRSEDAGLRWTRLPGSTSYDLTDVTQVAGHRLVLVGGGVLWTSDDAGRAWTPRSAPRSCRANWVRFAAVGAGVVHCDGDFTLRSVDGGASWIEGGALPATQPPIWFDSMNAVALALDGRAFWVTDDAGASWHRSAPPVPVVASLARTADGLSIATAQGHVFAARRPAGRWRTLRSAAEPGADVLAHRVLVDGRIVLLEGAGPKITSGDAPARLLAPAPAAFALALTGDGGAVVLQHGATTYLRPR